MPCWTLLRRPSKEMLVTAVRPVSNVAAPQSGPQAANPAVDRCDGAGDQPYAPREGKPLLALGIAWYVERKPYFIQISDSHLFEDPAARLWDVAPDPHLDAVVDALAAKAPDPEFVIVTGDCSADGSPESYRRLREKVARLSAPAYYLPGNHDDAPYMARYLADRTLARFEKFTQVFDACGWRVVMLDSSVVGEDGGSIGNEQREWLRARLARDPKMPTIVAMHHNPLPVDSRWLDKMTISDAPALLAVLDTAPQVKLV